MPIKKKGKRQTNSATTPTVTKIPPPPGPDALSEEIDEYFSKYSFEDLEQAGHMRTLNKAETTWVNKLSAAAEERIAMRKSRSQLNLALSSEQLTRFTKYASQKHIPPSTLARAWVLERLDAESNKA